MNVVINPLAGVDPSSFKYSVEPARIVTTKRPYCVMYCDATGAGERGRDALRVVVRNALEGSNDNGHFTPQNNPVGIIKRDGTMLIDVRVDYAQPEAEDEVEAAMLGIDAYERAASALDTLVQTAIYSACNPSLED
jgi:hypothetical protein